jgi:hypothetical protein
MSEIFFTFLIVIFLCIILIPVFFRKRRNKSISNPIKPDLNAPIGNLKSFGNEKSTGPQKQKRQLFGMDEQLRQQKRIREQAEEQFRRQRQMQDRAADQLRQQNRTQEFLQQQRKQRERIAQQQQDVLNRMRRNNWK